MPEPTRERWPRIEYVGWLDQLSYHYLLPVAKLYLPHKDTIVFVSKTSLQSGELDEEKWE